VTPGPGYTFIPHLLDEVEIPQHGTLSRVMFSGDGLRVVLFAFDEGQDLTDHTASFPAVIQVVRGRLSLTLGEDTVEIGADSWVHMDAHLTHAVVALEPSVLVLTLQKET
jgi:quercetin dioxygenase-like cupin family protein